MTRREPNERQRKAAELARKRKDDGRALQNGTRAGRQQVAEERVTGQSPSEKTRLQSDYLEAITKEPGGKHRA